jgi:hypothetical protein
MVNGQWLMVNETKRASAKKIADLSFSREAHIYHSPFTINHLRVSAPERWGPA